MYGSSGLRTGVVFLFLVGSIQNTKAPAVGHVHDDLLGRTGGIGILRECSQEFVQLRLHLVVQAQLCVKIFVVAEHLQLVLHDGSQIDLGVADALRVLDIIIARLFQRDHPLHKFQIQDVELLIQMRYMDAVLSNRAGSAPNKTNDVKIIKETCLMPYTDMFIFPDGRMGICCCDNFEATTLADLTKTPLKEAWNSPQYQKLRKDIRTSRADYTFCKYCDFIDAGLRMDTVDDTLHHREANHGARQSLFRK